MIISRIFQGQGFGNQLWCIFTAYALAKKKGYSLGFLDPNSLFLGSSIFSFSKKLFFNHLFVKEKYYEKGYYHKNLNTYLYDFDSNVLNVKPQTEIIGNFQSEKYFFGFEEFIKKNFPICNYIQKLSSQFNKYNVLNIRGGEYKRHKKLLLPENYWRNIYKLLKKKSDLPIICVSDDYRYAKKLFPYLEVISEDISSCFAAIMGSPNVALSNSSFSYFPIFFGTPKSNIFAPYQWARFNNSEKLWCSPCNFYKKWQWVNFEGNIVSKVKCIQNYNNSLKQIKQSCTRISFPLSLQKNIITKYIKKKLKSLLGLFYWRYQ